MLPRISQLIAMSTVKSGPKKFASVAAVEIGAALKTAIINAAGRLRTDDSAVDVEVQQHRAFALRIVDVAIDSLQL